MGLPAGEPSLESRLEALLFVSVAPLTPHQLASVLGTTPHRVEKALEALKASLVGRGLRVQRHPQGYQLTTAPEVAADVQRLLNLESTARLTRAAIEVLAIVAYQRRVTRPQIDAIRGVNSDSALRTLLRHGLIEEVGRSEGPGRPILYAPTPEFLQHFGLSSLEDLPPLDLEFLPDMEDQDGETQVQEAEGD
jgi:segregation and condensation protein B